MDGFYVVYVTLHLLTITCADLITKIVCFNDTLQLKCEVGTRLEIVEAYYQILEKDSTFCRHVNKTDSPCYITRSVSLVRNKCNGKGECMLSYEIDSASSGLDCKPSMYSSMMYLTVSYKCGISKTTANNNTNITTNVVPNKRLGDLVYMTLMKLFFGFSETLRQIKENPRKVVLCVILSLSAGVALLILYVFLVGCCAKYRKRKGELDIEDGPKTVIISSPTLLSTEPVKYETVLVTRQNGVALCETQLSSDSTLLARKGKGKKVDGKHQVISTIRRSHSVDEGTQTDNEEAESVDLRASTLSPTEAQELGYLVDVMKYYNNRLDDDFYPYPQTKNTPNSKNSQKPHNSIKFNFSISEDQSHIAEIKPLISKQTSSSTSTDPSNYSLIEGYSSSEERLKTLPKHNNSRNLSEISYETSASNVSNNSVDLYSPGAIFNGNTLQQNSMQRRPKHGVRGDGYEYIVTDTKTSHKHLRHDVMI